MGNTQPLAQRLGFEAPKVVQKEKYRIVYSHYSIKGKRPIMEDYLNVILSYSTKHYKAIPVPDQMEPGADVTDKEYASYFSIFDGHSGPLCAEYVADNLPNVIEDNPNYPNDVGTALCESFRDLDKKWLQEQASQDSNSSNFWELDKVTKRGHLEDGCTALVCILQEDVLYVANSGDCRGILINIDGTIVPISHDHNPDDPVESARIIEAGGTVKKGRINGRLGVSRGFGAYPYKNVENFGDRLVSVEPDISSFQITPETSYLILATDGVWDKLSNEEVAKIVQDSLSNRSDNEIYRDTPEKPVFEACLEVVKQADERKSSDNISVIVVTFDHVPANTAPTYGGGFIEALKRRTQEIGASIAAKKDEIAQQVEPKLSEWSESVRNSALNSTLKSKSSEFSEMVSQQATAFVERVNGLLKSPEEEKDESVVEEKEAAEISQETKEPELDSSFNEVDLGTPVKPKNPLLEDDSSE